jgi:methyltransferase
VTTLAIVIGVVFGLMLAEQRVSSRHEKALRAAGAIEPPGDVYGAMRVLYPGAFLAMAVEGLWRTGHAPAAASDGPAWAVSGVLLFAASKALKFWAIATLGERWSFRVLIQPGRPLVAGGPYRSIRHPNYVAVMGELVGAAMMMGARLSGPVMIGTFGLVLLARIRFEERALGLRSAASSGPATSEQKGL